MHSILIVLKKPAPDQDQAEKHWLDCISRIATAKELAKPGTELLEGAYQIRESNELPLLGRVLTVAEKAGVSYRVLLIEQATEWSHTPIVTPPQ